MVRGLTPSGERSSSTAEGKSAVAFQMQPGTDVRMVRKATMRPGPVAHELGMAGYETELRAPVTKAF